MTRSRFTRRVTTLVVQALSEAIVANRLFGRCFMFDKIRFGTLAVAISLSGGVTACSGAKSQVLPPLSSQSSMADARSAISSAATGSAALLSGFAPLTSVASAAGAGEMPLSADSLPGDHDAENNFIDSIGVNLKLGLSGSVYSNYSQVKEALVRLGVRHVRDSLFISNPDNYEQKLEDLSDNGIHSALGLALNITSSNVAQIKVTADQAVAYLRAGHFASSIEAVEGINEPDINQNNSGGPAPSGWVDITRTQQRDLYNGVQGLAKRLPVYGPSPQVTASVLKQLGNLSQYMTFGNAHDYSGGYNLTSQEISTALSTEQIMSGVRPVLSTENGYSTGTMGEGMPDLIMLDYAQRMFFKQFMNGVRRTYWYELADESPVQNQYWHNAGLVNNDFTQKSAYVGLKNIIALLSDRTAYTSREPLNVSFSGQAQFENLTHLLLQKNDGSYWIAVWTDVSEWTPGRSNTVPGSLPPKPPSYINTMNFVGTDVASITRYHEDFTGAMTSWPVEVNNGSAQITVSVRPTIFKIVVRKAPAAVRAPAVSNPAAHWSFDEGVGTVAADSVNSAGNMTIPTAYDAAWVNGKYRAGIGLYGTQATTSKTFINTTQSYSATAWVELNSLVGFQAAVAANGASQAAFALDFTPQSNLSFTTYNPSGASRRIGSSVVPQIGRWYAVAGTYNGTTHKMSFYVNGTLQGTTTAPQVFNATGGTEVGSMDIASIGHYQWWYGGVDEVNLYQRELSPAEVATMAAR